MPRIYCIAYLLLTLLLASCSSTGIVDNQPISNVGGQEGYSINSWAKSRKNDEFGLLISFSGGGTRAAALAYGVLKGLRDTSILIDGKPARMIDQVDYITSVSGGSFTAAYYGLHGDGIFDTFEEKFLLQNVEKPLWKGLLSPAEWFREGSRTETAFRYYNKHIFNGATFADMNLEQGPLIVINASDLGYGVRFSFLQEYFNLICSDIDSFPVARAVTASSAVPVVFIPVVLENYSQCNPEEPEWLKAIRKNTGKRDLLVSEMVEGIESLLKKEQRQYIHLVDGGITDNLGLHAAFDIINLSGGIRQTMKYMDRKPPRYMVVISVNASTNPEPTMGQSKKEPSLSETIGAMSDVQLHRYNTITLDLMEQNIKKWASELSTDEQQVKPFFIHISLNDIPDPEQQQFINNIPTSFSLSQEQVNSLILAGSNLLQENAQYKQLISDLKESQLNKN